MTSPSLEHSERTVDGSVREARLTDRESLPATRQELDEGSESTLLPMLIVGLVLVLAGMLIMPLIV